MRKLARAMMIALLCAACRTSPSADGSSSSDRPRVWAVRPELPPGPLRIAPQNAAPAINIVGILVYNAANNCFLLDWGGGFTQPLVWPAGTSAASDGVGVVLANGHVVHAGDLVKGRGRNRQVADAWGIPKACRSRDGGVLLLQSL